MRGQVAIIGRTDRLAARRWLLLAVSSLVLAGLLALLLVVGRTPGIDRLITDPLLFRRALVVHVDLSLVVWFYAFLAGLFSLLPSAARAGSGLLARTAPSVGALGVGLLVSAALVPGAAPVLSNYVPVIDHPLFLAGLIVFGGALALGLVGPRLLPGNEGIVGPVPVPIAARPGLRVAAICVLLALITFAATALSLPRWLDAKARYEILFWGGGHVLQIASEAAMVAVWIMLLTGAVGREVVSRRTSNAVFGALLLPALLAPLLCASDPTGSTYRLGFTRLMQWGLFPAVSFAFAAIVRSLLLARRAGRLPEGFFRDGRFIAFAASAGLTTLGFLLGALIRGSNTMVPAHYHAAIGGVTASFMGVAYTLYAPLGLRAPAGRLLRLSRIQPLVFGAGQAVFAVGFGLAGAAGMGRKSYGAEQLHRGAAETFGLAVMGLGGLVAVLGGLIFIVVAVNAWRRAGPVRSASAHLEGGSTWTLATTNPHSRG